MAEHKASCLLMKDGKLLLVRKKSDLWGLPGGTVLPDEDEQTVALKFMEEISGVKARVIQLFSVYEFQKEGHNIEQHIFEVESDSELAPAEGYEILWTPLTRTKGEKIGEEVLLVLEDMGLYTSFAQTSADGGKQP